MFGGDVLVLETAHLVERGHQHRPQRTADGRLGDADLLGTVFQPGMQARGQRLRGHFEAAAEQGGDEPVILLEQRKQHVLGLDGWMLQLLGDLLGGGQRFLRALGEPIQYSRWLIPPGDGS